MAKTAANGKGSGDAAAPIDRPICGIVMPISLIDGCSEAHWAEVLDIVRTAAENAGFDANLVSTADDVGIIQKRIIQNLYDNPIVVCDVSGRNPNVMFELGLRLAFDKPTIIIKDDKTSYAFDTAPIEHLEYPRDLRFSRIVDFKQKLADKIQATHDRATSDKKYTTFLKHFGEFKVATVETKEVSGQEFILEEMKEIKSMLRSLRIGDRISRGFAPYKPRLMLEIEGLDDDKITRIRDQIEGMSLPMELNVASDGHATIDWHGPVASRAYQDMMTFVKSLDLDAKVRLAKE